MSAYKIDKTLESFECAIIYTSRRPENSREALRHVVILAKAVNLLEDTLSSSQNEMIAKLLVKAKKLLMDAEKLQEKLESEEAGASASGGGGGSGGGASASGGGDEPTMTEDKPAQ
jgi:uncharacterized membrane protein YgcG